MEAVRHLRRPHLVSPVAVLAFEGWNDAGEAATTAARYLAGNAATRPFAVVEPDAFFDFRESRPNVEIVAGEMRRIDWPDTVIEAGTAPSGADLIVVTGPEPSLRWKTYSRAIVSTLARYDVQRVILLGAFLSDVDHRAEVPLSIVGAHEPGLHADLADYSGPTGIVGILHEACRESGIPATSLWAAAPHYLAPNVVPTVAARLADAANDLLGLGIDTASMSRRARRFMHRVDEALAEQSEEELDPRLTRDLVDEIEDFLRDQG